MHAFPHCEPCCVRLQLEEAVWPVLLRLAAQYLVLERRRGAALDPVANFHLRNGAWLWQLNWLADPSPRGMQASYGIMVNYKYVLADVQRNNRSYVMDSRIAAMPMVTQMLGEQHSNLWIQADSSTG